MTKRYTIVNLFGFEVKLHASWILLALLIGWSLASGYFPNIQSELSVMEYWIISFFSLLGLFGSIIVHEFVHAKMARRFGLSTKGITFFVFGGVAELGDEPFSPKADFYIAIAGPVSSLILFVVFGLAANFSIGENANVLISMTFQNISQINLILAFFNMMPAFPLDGGRFLRAMLWAINGSPVWATKWASRISVVFGFTLVFIGFVGLFTISYIGGMWWIFIGWIISHIAIKSYALFLLKNALKGESAESLLGQIGEIGRVVPPNTIIDSALDNFFLKCRKKSLPVVEKNKILGRIDKSDIKRFKDKNDVLVKDVMHPCSEFELVEPNENAYEIFVNVFRNDKSDIYVVEKDKYLGTLTKKNLTDKFLIEIENNKNKFKIAS